LYFLGANGTVENEVSAIREGTGVFEIDFKNCLWKIETQPPDVTSSGMIENQDPLFETVDTGNSIYDFRLKEGSPAINTGLNTAFLTDLDGITGQIFLILAHTKQPFSAIFVSII
jgi:hypothetical protein